MPAWFIPWPNGAPQTPRWPGTLPKIVFIRFAKNPPRVRNHAELAAWLHRTTVNVTIDTWRSENRRHNREQQAVAMETTSLENALWDDLSPNLDEALNQLNDADRQAVLLRFFGQKTMRDVGVALGVSEDAAKMRVGRALDRLRTQLGVRSAACTAAVLGTILAERSVEAAPRHLVSQLAAMKIAGGRRDGRTDRRVTANPPVQAGRERGAACGDWCQHRSSGSVVDCAGSHNGNGESRDQPARQHNQNREPAEA